jgi:hypothetical protein
MAADGPVALKRAGLLETARTGNAVLAPLDRGDARALVRVHEYATVAATTKTGDVLWERRPSTFAGEWISNRPQQGVLGAYRRSRCDARCDRRRRR